MRFLLCLMVLILPLASVRAEESDLDRAMADSIALFEAVYPTLGQTLAGVDLAAYRDALSLQRFRSSYWGGEITLRISSTPEAGGDCSRFAAYTRIPPENGAVRLVLCPEFFTTGADALRRLTILHEMVHVVSGPDECRAMAFAAAVEGAGLGSYTPVDSYWAANGCANGPFSLP